MYLGDMLLALEEIQYCLIMKEFMYLGDILIGAYDNGLII